MPPALVNGCQDACQVKACNLFGPASLGGTTGALNVAPAVAYCSAYTSNNNQHHWYASPQLMTATGAPVCAYQRVISDNCGAQLDVWFSIPKGMIGYKYDLAAQYGQGSYAICWDYAGGRAEGANLMQHLGCNL
ncbi:hypothetical protein DFJ73DRAFT_759595 [Zopfochytrium polystomum]|nr:hypothetical protein DFJ73DRAFT_759595 [Zopfochytrium polystomum]